jgi:hypothetical protein
MLSKFYFRFNFFLLKYHFDRNKVKVVVKQVLVKLSLFVLGVISKPEGHGDLVLSPAAFPQNFPHLFPR